MQTRHYLAFLWLLCISVLSACSSSKNITHFYSLTTLAQQTENAKPHLTLGVGPVQIPRLLRRPQLVIRKNQTEVDLLERHQWGGSLREDIITTLSRNLSILLATDRVEAYPWKHSNRPMYQVRVNIEQLDGDLGKIITLKARWHLLQNRKVIVVKHEEIRVKTIANDHNAYVTAQSQAVYRLAQKIAAQL